MILDDIDINILKTFNKLKEDTNKNPTLWCLTKKIFPVKTSYETHDKYEFIKKRIKKLNGLFFVKKVKRKNEYYLIKDFVIFKIHKFPCGIRKALFILSDGKWSIFQL